LLREDCGKCLNCLDKVRFGGPNKRKRPCALRACWDAVIGPSTPRVPSTALIRTTPCPSCDGIDVANCGSGSRYTAVNGSAASYIRYSCRGCGHQWQMTPPGRAPELHPPPDGAPFEQRVKKHVCDECGDVFERKLSLQRHMQKMHPANPDTAFRCKRCTHNAMYIDQTEHRAITKK